MNGLQERIRGHLRRGGRVWLFLDYDGTLADFAPTPDVVLPDPELIDLLKRLSGQSGVRLTIVSGRTLAHVCALVPLEGIWLAGTYGVELRSPQGERTERLAYPALRLILDKIKPAWQEILSASSDFFLEDKGWTLAIHARYADEVLARKVLQSAERVAHEQIAGTDFRLLEGHRFLEVSPKLADKGLAVEHLLRTDPWPGALPVYIGDDDKDIRAFALIHAHGGLALLVGDEHQTGEADGKLASPGEVRAWLARTFLRRLSDVTA